MDVGFKPYGKVTMIRYSFAALFLCSMGCADNSPDPQKVLETSRKTTSEIKKKFEETQKSFDEKIQAIKQKSPAQADPK